MLSFHGKHTIAVQPAVHQPGLCTRLKMTQVGGYGLVVSAMLLYKKQYLRKAESMDRSFVSCDYYSGSYADSETFNSISYADCAGIEIPKVRYINK